MPYKPPTTPAPATRDHCKPMCWPTRNLTGQGYAIQSVEYSMPPGLVSGLVQGAGIDRIEAITRPILQRYQRYLYYAISRSGKPLSVASQRNRLTAVRTWFRFLMRENLILYNPASELELPKPERRLPKHTLTADEAEWVLAQPTSTPIRAYETGPFWKCCTPPASEDKKSLI